jgi:hypothetical protein
MNTSGITVMYDHYRYDLSNRTTANNDIMDITPRLSLMLRTAYQHAQGGFGHHCPKATMDISYQGNYGTSDI